MIGKRCFILIASLLLIVHGRAQVVLNEVMVYPGGNQGLIVFNGGSGNEYIELYNPSCSSVDVSGYFIGDGQDFAGFISGGAFRIPNVPGAVIPPNGHLVLGTSTSSADPNSVDIKLPDYTGNYCLNTAGKNFILANADGWVALYNAAGVPVDAIYWSSSASNINSNASDFGPVPCVPSGSGGVVLSSAQQINTGYAGVLKYAGGNPASGTTFSRMPDGGNWQGGVTPSINDLTTGNCNGGTCVSATTFQIPANITQPSCTSNNGVITITPSPSGAYTYIWSPNVSTTNSANNLAAGTYSVNVNSGGCHRDTVITLKNPAGPTAIAINSTNASCGLNNGSVTLGTVTGGTGPYTYNFNNGGFSGAKIYNNLGSGNYPVVVKDANGCTFTDTAKLTASTSISAQAATTVDATCGTANGSVTLGVTTGGASPYTYNFDNKGFSSNTIYNSLTAGSYLLIVKDINGCTFTDTIIIHNTNGPSALASTPVDASCGQNNGSITLGAVTGGTGPYTYNFDNSGFTGNTVYNNLAAGNHTVVVKDSKGCTFTTTITLAGSTAPTSISSTVLNPTCAAGNGTLTIGATTGGTAPYTYNFDNNGFSSTSIYTNLSAGNYTLIAQDANGCTYTTSVTLASVNIPLTAQVSMKSPGCNDANGSVSIKGVKGGSAPYQFNFNNGGFSSDVSFMGLISGSYNLVIKDSSGCLSTQVVTVPVSDEEAAAFVPNSFTPNGDGLNESWAPQMSCVQEYTCNIYNRWGELINTLSGNNSAWDGTYKQGLAKEDVYVYLLEIVDFRGQRKSRQGHIILIR